MKGFPIVFAFIIYITSQSLASPAVKNNVRVFRSNSYMTHYYTIDPSQMETWITSMQGQSQGDTALVFGTLQPLTTPVFAVHNSDADFIYTTSSDEVNTLVAEGWVDLGIYWYAFTAQVCDSVPLYVVDNPTMTDHLYATNSTERDVAISSQGYVDEGIAMYVLPLSD
ncbi:hypothetical protein EWM64_g6965 [Hericium alpestre]|uniref:DUF5648 domain-containing protein n=1 Tax=Hericium alpestre TaxID=135208 RepID=A0A4Y9ZSL5_9AGAM|nr:hypothetical protein EWM64_g6965 [Hericium alpestre]